MSYAVFQLVFLLIGCSLAVDTLTGFLVSGLGLDLKLSAIYKFGLLLITLFALACYSRKKVTVVFCLLLSLLIGPFINLLNELDVIGFVVDFSYVIKILTPFIIFLYCTEVVKKWPEKSYQFGHYVFYFGFLILVFNLVAGVLGYGFSSYGSDDDGESSIGIKGFFYAGNEVSCLFLILFSYALNRAWNAKRKIYFFMLAPFVVLSGALIATKAAMIAGLLLIFIIPLVNERQRLFRLTWLKISIFAPVIVMVSIIGVYLVPILEAAGIWARLVWFYEKKGVMGIILSGRNEFAAKTTESFYASTGIFEHIWGVGLSGLTKIERMTVEIEPIDLYFWFGIPGITYLTLLFGAFIYFSYRATLSQYSTWAPFALAANLLLAGLSVIAGHTLTSGMLGPLLGLLNGLVYMDYVNTLNKKKVYSH
tara:strand:- start:5907 stop:7172 length:1266 start_codon:yes stop_codon:yes gene_type:complete